ncbi:hypothetical protein D7Y21_26725 [Corallococcus sp. AB045]|nr:hypothetical protein D7Y21_26725 [Corallococcus sp. AB045]
MGHCAPAPVSGVTRPLSGEANAGGRLPVSRKFLRPRQGADRKKSRSDRDRAATPWPPGHGFFSSWRRRNRRRPGRPRRRLRRRSGRRHPPRRRRRPRGGRPPRRGPAAAIRDAVPRGPCAFVLFRKWYGFSR